MILHNDHKSNLHVEIKFSMIDLGLYIKATSTQIGRRCNSFSNPNKKEYSDSLIGVFMGIKLPTWIIG